MTGEEFEAKQKEELKGLPEEFHSFVRMFAYEHGHSSGYDEVLNYVLELASELKPAVEKYRCYLRENGG
jgi:hypothetical protein